MEQIRRDYGRNRPNPDNRMGRFCRMEIVSRSCSVGLQEDSDPQPDFGGARKLGVRVGGADQQPKRVEAPPPRVPAAGKTVQNPGSVRLGVLIGEGWAGIGRLVHDERSTVAAGSSGRGRTEMDLSNDASQRQSR